MSQADYNVANGSGAVVRADINAQLDAGVTLNSGATAPTTTFTFMWWADTATGILKQRNAANTAFIDKGLLAEEFAVLGTAQSFTATQSWAKGADVASATALTVGTDGNTFDITGTTAITSITTIGTGTEIKLHFDAGLVLTHNITNLVLFTLDNITTQAGDEATFFEFSTGNWRMTKYSRADGTALVGGTGGGPSVGTGSVIRINRRNIQEDLILREDFNEDLTVSTGGDTLSVGTDDNFNNGDITQILASVFPGGLAVDTDFYVVGATSSTIQLALTHGGSAINITTTGTDVDIYKPANGMTAGPTTIETGSTVTVPSGSTWNIL